MKRLLSLLLAAIFLTFSGTAVFASENAEISFDTYSSENGKKVCVDVNISKDGNPVMLQYCVAYDSSALEVVSVTTGDAFSGNSSPLVNPTDGKIYFIWDSFDPIKEGGTMLHVEFAPKTEDKTEVWIDETETFVVADSSFNEIGTVSGKAEINGVSSEKPKDESSSSSSEESKPSSEGSKPSSGSNNGINLDKNEVFVEVGGEIKVEITDTEEEEVFWYSSNESVVKVENDEIIPVAPGTATVTVTDETGEKEATVVITVTEEDLETESSETVEVIDNSEKEKSTGGFIWIIVAVLAAAVAGTSWLVYKKSKK